MHNPFIFSHIVTDNYFCKRDDLDTLKNYMLDSIDVVLFSKRRYGKSSLIQEIFKNHIDNDKYLTIYFDIFDISNANDFAYSFYKAVAKSFKTDMKTILKTLKQLFSKTTFSATVTDSGEVEFKPSITNLPFDDMIEDIFINLSSYLKRHNQKAIIAIDEFQQIGTIKEQNIEAILRKYIQNLDNISFVYSGSKRHLLTQIFTTHKKPFYNQAIPIELKPIPLDDFYTFIAKKFIDTNKFISKEAFALIYKSVDGESWLIQNISYHLWQKYDKINELVILDTLHDIVNMSNTIFKILFDSFSNTQKTALKTIVKNNGKNLLSKEVLSLQNISKSSLSSALKALYEKEIVDKHIDRYYINDKIFELWLLSNI